MGGTRFAGQPHDGRWTCRCCRSPSASKAVLDAVDQVLREAVGPNVDTSVRFVSPQDLRIFNAGLARRVAPFPGALCLDPGAGQPAGTGDANPGWCPESGCISPPCCPSPIPALKKKAARAAGVVYCAQRSVFLLLFIGLLVHWQSRPLKRLARAARDMSLGEDKVAGRGGRGSEVVEVGVPLTPCVPASAAT